MIAKQDSRKAADNQPSLAELIAAGLAHHQSGNLFAAEHTYEQVLATEPMHADALHLLGVLRGRTDAHAAIRLVAQAILANPRVSAYHNNLGNLLLRTGDLKAAEQAYRRALLLKAANADVSLNLGNLLATEGRDAEARPCFEQALRCTPGFVEAHMSMGRLEQRAGNWANAEDCFRRVTELAPGYAPAWLMLSAVANALGRREKEEQHLRRALAVDPGYADGYCNLGNLLRERERLTEAIECYRQAIALCPSSAEDAYNNLGVTLSALGRHQEALGALLQAVRTKPEYVPAYFNLAKEAILLKQDKLGFDLLAKVLLLAPAHPGAHLELGNLHRSCGRLAEAVESYRGALATGIPNPAGTYSNLGAALAELTQFDEAEAALRKSLVLEPEASNTWCNWGVLQEKQGLLQAAAKAYRRAIELSPSFFEARMNLASVSAQMGEEEGLTLLDELVCEQPLSAHAQWTRGIHLLLHGRYLEGWPGLEWRDRVEALGNVPRHFTQPRWQGEPLAGRTVLLYAEQGFGDTLQFVRYAPLVAALGASVVLEVQPKLQPLLEEYPGVSACVLPAEQHLPAFDVHAPLMSLPCLLGTTRETIPPPVAPRVAERSVPAAGSLRVGLVWAGNPKHTRDYVRSTALSLWQGLAAVDGASFLSLQVGPAERETAEYGACFHFRDRPSIRNFKDTAEILATLDLVITVDSAVAHLAGMMHKPVWILLDTCCDWRWGLAGTRTPWYPSARLFRQTRAGDWSGPMGEVTRALRDRCDAAQGNPPSRERNSAEHR